MIMGIFKHAVYMYAHCNVLFVCIYRGKILREPKGWFPSRYSAACPIVQLND